MGAHGVTHGAIAQFLGAWEARKNRGGFRFWNASTNIHREFPRAESWKSFDSAPTYQNILTALAFWRAIHFSKESLSLFSLWSRNALTEIQIFHGL